ncbi:MAG: hypothetical protein SF066_03495 [Thermoanaerobaculia bacterium]|nr:hypothetical protein [Thermoanaerobaculia bacterium]
MFCGSRGLGFGRWVLFIVVVTLLGSTGSAQSPQVSPAVWKPEIPRTWDDAALASLEIPLALADANSQPKHVDSGYYYRIVEKQIYKSYPVYHPDREPPGYFDQLLQREPEIAFDPTRLKTKEDWIAAGEVVFDAALVFDALLTVDDVRNRDWYGVSTVPVAADGTVPFFRYFILEKGKVALGEFSCGTCHTRVLPDGKTIKGAQGNYPIAHLDALSARGRVNRTKDPVKLLTRFHEGAKAPFGAPWLGANDPAVRYAQLSLDETVEADAAIPAGVQPRFGTSAFHPAQVPDLIGIAERRYLDRTGHVRHRDVGDVMRYAALNQGLGFFDSFGDFRPAGSELPDPTTMERYSDEMLYALGLYLYSLQPPPNPHPFDAAAARGAVVFENEGCWRCHTPPAYTSNRLTPVEGFTPPPNHPQAADIIPDSVGTDPGLALYTRRGTGFYKVPSLKGVWYRGPFQHSGQVATLEDWFDPRRLEPDYVPTGFRGPLGKPGPVKGHPFGLKLTAEDRRALIAFLKTL